MTSIKINDAKNANYSNIFNFIYSSKDGVSKQDISRNLQLSLPTINRWLAEMQADGLVESSGYQEHTGGRHATKYSVCHRYRAAVGVEIEPEKITAVVVDLSGTIIVLEKHDLIFERSSTYYQRIGDVVNHIVASSGIPQEQFLGVGIGIPGLVTKDHSRALHGKILDLSGWDVQHFKNYISLPCRMFNDAKAAGFAEIWIRKNLNNAIYVLLGNHVGGALILDGQVNLGENTNAGEIGHTTIIPNGKLCYCGQKGCMEAYCASSVLTAHSNGDIDFFFDKLKAKDPVVTKAWDEYIYHLSSALHNVDMLFNCPIILGGKVGALCEEHISDLRKLISSQNPFSDSSMLIHPCICKKEAISTGAALSFIDEFVKAI